MRLIVSLVASLIVSASASPFMIGCAESAPIAPEVSDDQLIASLSARHFDPEDPSESLKSEAARERLEAIARDHQGDQPAFLAERAAAALQYHGASESSRALLLTLAEGESVAPGLREAALRSLGVGFADRDKERLLKLSERLIEHPRAGIAREARLLGLRVRVQGFIEPGAIKAADHSRSSRALD